MTRLFPIIALASLAACQPLARDLPPPQDEAPAADCPIVGSGDWVAFVNAMPGPGARPTLIVTGKVSVPTGRYRVAFSGLVQIAESDPLQVTLFVNAIPPSGPASQAIVVHDVRTSLPAQGRIGLVTIRCGDRTLASIRNIEIAR